MQKYWLRGLPLLFALVAVVALFSDTPASVRAASLTIQQTQAQATPQRFTAFAANLSGRGRAAQTVDIEIKHWSTDAQRDELLQVLRNKGEQALLDALQKMPVVGPSGRRTASPTTCTTPAASRGTTAASRC